VLFVLFLRDLFHFARLHLIDLVICLTAGAFSVMWFEGGFYFSICTSVFSRKRATML